MTEPADDQPTTADDYEYDEAHPETADVEAEAPGPPDDQDDRADS